MAEQGAIDQSTRPATVSSLAADLRALGLDSGMTVMVHSSLSGLGYVAGGARAVVTALLDVLGENGTLAMPTHSSDLTDPESWSNPPVPESWWDEMRAEMPAYDPVLTPTRLMGAIVECFRHVPGVRRSAHPTVSAAAFGPNAEQLVAHHELAHGLGESSPQARLYELDGHILLLGVTHANNTSLHLAEYRAVASGAGEVTATSPVVIDGRRQWVTYANLDESTFEDSDVAFPRLGEAFAATGAESVGPVGAGIGRLMRARGLVDFATAWMRTNGR
jgi:aminoglycoside 3-N-acetyltransferase